MVLAAALVAAGASAQDMRVARDPVTGQLRAPNAAEAAALAPGAVQARGLITGRINPAPVRHANGMVEQELDESSLLFTVVRRNADGSLTSYCLPHAEAQRAAIMLARPDTKPATTTAKGATYAEK